MTYILPLVQRFHQQAARQGIDIHFQHDNAPSYRARITQDTLAAMGITLIRWPPNSPDLSPIENVWPWMKEWIEAHGNIQDLNQAQLHCKIQKAWDQVPSDFLLQLAHSMLRRLQMVIDSGGGTINC